MLPLISPILQNTMSEQKKKSFFSDIDLFLKKLNSVSESIEFLSNG